MMDAGQLLVVERLMAQAEQIDALKRSLQVATERLRQIAGVHQVELLQSQQHPAEFIFFLIVDDLASVSELLEQAEWHQQLIQALPHLIEGEPERVVGSRLA